MLNLSSYMFAKQIKQEFVLLKIYECALNLQSVDYFEIVSAKLHFSHDQQHL